MNRKQTGKSLCATLYSYFPVAQILIRAVPVVGGFHAVPWGGGVWTTPFYHGS